MCLSIFVLTPLMSGGRLGGATGAIELTNGLGSNSSADGRADARMERPV
jgi:hypothetical protein